jgi:hypothetical protein
LWWQHVPKGQFSFRTKLSKNWADISYKILYTTVCNSLLNANYFRNYDWCKNAVSLNIFQAARRWTCIQLEVITVLSVIMGVLNLYTENMYLNQNKNKLPLFWLPLISQIYNLTVNIIFKRDCKSTGYVSINKHSWTSV